jgi:hypothetical protein
MSRKEIEMCLLTKKAGVIGGEAVNYLREALSGAICLEMLVEVSEAGEVQPPHQLADASRDQLLLSSTQFNAEFFVREC